MFTMKDRVCVSRTGPDGRMKLAGAMDVIQDCSLLWFETEPALRDYLASNNLGMFFVSRQIDIVRMPLYGENFTVQTSAFAFKSFCGYRNTVLYGEDRRPCLLTWSSGAFVNKDTEVVFRLPQREINKITIDDKVDMEYLPRKISLPSVPGKRLAAVPVRHNDIDINRHMNNAKYIEAALEFLPEDFVIKRLRVEYRTQAKLGDWLYPQLITGERGELYILLLNAEDSPFAVLEFS